MGEERYALAFERRRSSGSASSRSIPNRVMEAD